MAANRSQSMMQALNSVWNRGGVAGFYQGLIPWVSQGFIPILMLSILCATFKRNMMLTFACARSLSQAWIEASTKGAVLIFTASEIESRTIAAGLSPAAAGLVGGMGGGIAQAYLTMGAYESNVLLRRFRLLMNLTPSSFSPSHLYSHPPTWHRHSPSHVNRIHSCSPSHVNRIHSCSPNSTTRPQHRLLHMYENGRNHAS